MEPGRAIDAGRRLCHALYIHLFPVESCQDSPSRYVWAHGDKVSWISAAAPFFSIGSQQPQCLEVVALVMHAPRAVSQEYQRTRPVGPSPCLGTPGIHSRHCKSLARCTRCHLGPKPISASQGTALFREMARELCQEMGCAAASQCVLVDSCVHSAPTPT